jgi:hypothetical protein
MRERHWPYTTPESKRELADSLDRDRDFWGNLGDEWRALADLQEQGRLEEYHAARAAWKTTEPQARDFV